MAGTVAERILAEFQRNEKKGDLLTLSDLILGLICIIDLSLDITIISQQCEWSHDPLRNLAGFLFSPSQIFGHFLR